MPEQVTALPSMPPAPRVARYRLGGDAGPIVEHVGPSNWQGCEQWRVVERGVWYSAAWAKGTIINAPCEEARETDE